MTTVATDDDRANAAEKARPLAELVRSRHAAGRSYRDMSEAAKRAGYTISHSQLQAFATDMVRKAPDNKQLAALAAELGPRSLLTCRPRRRSTCFEWCGRGSPVKGDCTLANSVKPAVWSGTHIATKVSVITYPAVTPEWSER